jgi:hypothetical protein
MQRFYRLEDALPAWRAQVRRLGSLSTPDDPPSRRLASSCLAWMTEQGCWPNRAADKERVTTEIESALRHLVVAAPASDSAGETTGGAWAIPAAAGSAIGALLVSPLTFLWFDNRLIGLFVGGTLGAFLAVKGIAALLERPRLVAMVRSAAALSSGGVVVGGVFRAIRGASVGWLRSALWLLAAPLVLAVLKPRPATARGGPAPDDDIGRAADLALAVAWNHPERVTAADLRPPPPPEPLPRPVLIALSQLQADLVRRGSDRELRESGDDLLQRLQESGYAWQSVAKGTPYDPEMAAWFDVFGTIPPGQAVRTQRAAMTRNGQVVHKGELRRI